VPHGLPDVNGPQNVHQAAARVKPFKNVTFGVTFGVACTRGEAYDSHMPESENGNPR
jgi:hypothetical protein